MFSSKYQDLQQTVFGEIVFDDDFRKVLNIQNDGKENDYFKMAKIYKIHTYVCMCTHTHTHTHTHIISQGPLW